jgi:hypothetical protein
MGKNGLRLSINFEHKSSLEPSCQMGLYKRGRDLSVRHLREGVRGVGGQQAGAEHGHHAAQPTLRRQLLGHHRLCSITVI